MKKNRRAPDKDKQPTIDKMGKRILALREARKWTQLNLAKSIGLAGPNAGAAISRLENGKQSPTMRTLEKVAKALEVPVSTLLEENV